MATHIEQIKSHYALLATLEIGDKLGFNGNQVTIFRAGCGQGMLCTINNIFSSCSGGYLGWTINAEITICMIQELKNLTKKALDELSQQQNNSEIKALQTAIKTGQTGVLNLMAVYSGYSSDEKISSQLRDLARNLGYLATPVEQTFQEKLQVAATQLRHTKRPKELNAEAMRRKRARAAARNTGRCAVGKDFK